MKIDNWTYTDTAFPGDNKPTYVLRPLTRKYRIAARIALDADNAVMLAELVEKFELLFVESSENTEQLNEMQKETAAQNIFFELINKAFVTQDDKKKSS